MDYDGSIFEVYKFDYPKLRWLVIVENLHNKYYSHSTFYSTRKAARYAAKIQKEYLRTMGVVKIYDCEKLVYVR